MLRSVFGKVVHDQWRIVLGWAVFAGIWPAMYVALYPSIGAYVGADIVADIVATGLVRDPQGQKMSKTKGNVIDPLDVVYGATIEKLLERGAGVVVDALQRLQRFGEFRLPAAAPQRCLCLENQCGKRIGVQLAGDGVRQPIAVAVQVALVGRAVEVAVHTDDRAIGQLVVGKGLLLGCELPQLGAESVNGCF